MKGNYQFNESDNKLHNDNHSLEIFTMKNGRLGINSTSDDNNFFVGVLKELPNNLYGFFYEGEFYKLEVFETTARIF